MYTWKKKRNGVSTVRDVAHRFTLYRIAQGNVPGPLAL